MIILSPGITVEYIDCFTGGIREGVIQEVLSCQILLTNGIFVLNRNVKREGSIKQNTLKQRTL